MKTVGELKKWLANKPDELPVELMIETENCQYQFPLNDVAWSTDGEGGPPKYIILMHEKWGAERATGPKPE